jgi:drug/metabolite transporter (DMT)-like permease
MPPDWILFVIATVFLYGIGQVFTKKGTARLSSSGMLLLLSFNMLAIYGGAWLFLHKNTPIYFREIAYTVAATFLSSIGYIFFYEAVERQKISIVGTVTAAYPFITVILAVPLLNEPLTLLQISAVAMIVASVSVLSYAPGTQNLQNRSWLLFAILCFTMWGISSVVAKFSIDMVGPITYAGIYAVVGPCTWIPYWAAKSRKFHVTREDIPAELSVSFFCFGGLFLYTAIGSGYVSIVIALADLYPFVTVVFARIMLSERLEKHCQIAVALALLGISALAFG